MSKELENEKWDAIKEREQDKFLIKVFRGMVRESVRNAFEEFLNKGLIDEHRREL